MCCWFLGASQRPESSARRKREAPELGCCSDHLTSARRQARAEPGKVRAGCLQPNSPPGCLLKDRQTAALEPEDPRSQNSAIETREKSVSPGEVAPVGGAQPLRHSGTASVWQAASPFTGARQQQLSKKVWANLNSFWVSGAAVSAPHLTTIPAQHSLAVLASHLLLRWSGKSQGRSSGSGWGSCSGSFTLVTCRGVRVAAAQDCELISGSFRTLVEELQLPARCGGPA